MTKRRLLTSIDLFAGCGGLSLGLEQAGFKTLAFSELNKDAAATFAANRVDHAPRQFGAVSELLARGVIPGLLSEFARDGVKRVDLVAGGPQALGATKDLIRAVESTPLSKAVIADTATRIATIRASAEGQEGIRSFLEKRKPSWVDQG